MLIFSNSIYVRGVADITPPIDEYEKIIEFYDENRLRNVLPKNPYENGSEDYKLFDELLNTIESRFEDIGDELVIAELKCKETEWDNKWADDDFILDMEKITVEE